MVGDPVEPVGAQADVVKVDPGKGDRWLAKEEAEESGGAVFRHHVIAMGQQVGHWPFGQLQPGETAREAVQRGAFLGRIGFLRVQGGQQRAHRLRLQHPFQHLDGRAVLEIAVFQQTALQGNVDEPVTPGLLRCLSEEAALPAGVEGGGLFRIDPVQGEARLRHRPAPALRLAFDGPEGPVIDLAEDQRAVVGRVFHVKHRPAGLIRRRVLRRRVIAAKPHAITVAFQHARHLRQEGMAPGLDLGDQAAGQV